MKVTRKISKELLLRIIFFALITAAAVSFDLYFEKHPDALPIDEAQNDNKNTAEEHGTIYLISQINSLNAKTPGQKAPSRKLFNEAHIRFIQQCHHLQNGMALKTKIVIPKKQLYISLHYLNHSHLYSLHPDDEPFII